MASTRDPEGAALWQSFAVRGIISHASKSAAAVTTGSSIKSRYRHDRCCRCRRRRRRMSSQSRSRASNIVIVIIYPDRTSWQPAERPVLVFPGNCFLFLGKIYIAHWPFRVSHYALFTSLLLFCFVRNVTHQTCYWWQSTKPRSSRSSRRCYFCAYGAYLERCHWKLQTCSASEVAGGRSTGNCAQILTCVPRKTLEEMREKRYKKYDMKRTSSLSSLRCVTPSWFFLTRMPQHYKSHCRLYFTLCVRTPSWLFALHKEI